MIERVCSVADCAAPRYCKGLCSLHYQRQRRHGDVSHGAIRRAARSCTIDCCERPALTVNRTLCTTHYNRVKAGIPLDAPVRSRRNAHSVCIVDECDSMDKGPHGYCAKHLGRVKNNGSPDIVKHQRDRVGKLHDHPRWSGDEPSYGAAHLRVRAAKGPAKARSCEDCGGRASHWSYTHADPNELHAGAVAYSADPQFYVARCVSCHKRFDLGMKVAR